MICQTCGGTGVYHDYFIDPDVGEVYVEAYCSDCVKKGNCPQCGQFSEKIKRDYEEGNYVQCEHCGWKDEEVDA